MICPRPDSSTATTDGLFRLLSVAVRRYSRDPATRTHSARQAVLAAIALYAEETSAGDAALITSEGVAELARKHRLSR